MMKTIYIDSDFKCHLVDDGTMTAVETDFFDGTEYMHVTKKGEILTGQVTYNKGENYIANIFY